VIHVIHALTSLFQASPRSQLTTARPSGKGPISRVLTAFVVILLAAVVTAPIAGAVAVSADTPTETVTENASVVEPGDRLQGVVGVQEAEVSGDIEERAFGLAFTEAETNDSKAAVVESQVTSLEDRIERLENRTVEIRAARENGTIDESEYRARMAILATEAATARRLANETANATRRVPAEALAQRDVDPESVTSLGRRASNLSGPEVAGIARSIAGNGVGKRVAGRNRPNVSGPLPGVPGGGNGPPGQGNETDRPGGGNAEGSPSSAVHAESIGIREATSLPSDRRRDRGAFVPGTGAGAFEGRSGVPGQLAVTDTDEEVPLFTVGLRSTDPALVTLRLTFDLTTDTDRRAFETMQDDADARADVRDRFQRRMRSVANNTERRVDRNMTVSDPEIALTTSDDGDTGIVTLSVVWAELAGRAGGDVQPNLVITEPFASGFTPSREFTVRVLAPENYRLTRVRPEPMRQTETSASWAAGTSLDSFLLEFTPEDGTPLPTTAIEGFEPASPTPDTSTGDGGPSGATLAVGAVIAIAIAIGGFLAWRRRESD